MFSWKSLNSKIGELGYFFPLKNFVVSSFLVGGGVFSISLLYKIHILYILPLCIFSLLCLPSIIKSQYLYKYEEKRFIDICSWMEQMCSSFQKKPKILAALKDCASVLDGTLKDLTQNSVEHLEQGISAGKDIYSEALKLIEDRYSCKRLSSLLKFLVKIEISGGEYGNALYLLLGDIHSWIERTIFLQKKKKQLIVNYFIVVILSLISCTLAAILSYMSASSDNFMSGYLDITGNIAYQIMTVLFIGSCVASFALIQKKLTGSWLDYKKNESLIQQDYDTAVEYNYKKKTIRRVPVFTLLTVLSGLLLFLEIYIGAVLIFGIGGIYFAFPSIKYRGAKKRTIEEIKLSFPEWLRDIALNLQFHTIQMAVQYSLESAPAVLKSSLKIFIEELNENPTGIEPYHNFLKNFNLSEVKSAMRILYSMTEVSKENTQDMLNVLVEQNYTLIDKAEKSYDRSKFLMLNQLLYLPMVFSIFKIVMDLFLFANSFFKGFAEFGNFTM